jgi:hypothetical protein
VKPELAIKPNPNADAIGITDAVGNESHSQINAIDEAAELTIDQATEILSKTFANRIPHTKKERDVVSFVEHYLDSKKNPFPRPRMYLIERINDQWTVTLLDLELLRRGGRGGDIYVHVGEERGRLKVVDVTSGG